MAEPRKRAPKKPASRSAERAAGSDAPASGREWTLGEETSAAPATRLTRLELPAELQLEQIECDPTFELTVRSPRTGRWHMERLLGASGRTVNSRLGIAIGTPPDLVRDATLTELGRWQQLAESPISSRDLRLAAEVVRRTCEGLYAAVADSVTYALWGSHDGGVTWASVPLPGPAPAHYGTATVTVAGPSDLLVFVDDGASTRAWRATVPAGP